jgi:hypothetical protein
VIVRRALSERNVFDVIDELVDGVRIALVWRLDRHDFELHLVLTHLPQELGAFLPIACNDPVRVHAKSRIAVSQETFDELTLARWNRGSKAERTFDVPHGLPVRELGRSRPVALTANST